MLNLSWLGNCLGIMDIKSLVGRLRRFLLELGSSASPSGREGTVGERRGQRVRQGFDGELSMGLMELDMAQRSSRGGNASTCQLARFWDCFLYSTSTCMQRGF
jgi:hypothetical protein